MREEPTGDQSLGAWVPTGAAAGVRLAWSGQTHRGRIRKNNEDAFLALSFDAQGVRYLGKVGEATLAEADFVFAVSDGMGGARSGEFASRVAVDQITRLLPRAFRQGAVGLAAGFGDVLTELFTRIHAELSRLGQSYDECHGMGATLTLAWIVPGWLYFAHVGDARLYYLPHAGGLAQVSHDDTYVGHLRRTGQINERQARTHPRRSVLSKALGAGHQFVDPQLGAVAWEPGDRFLLATDGLIDGLWEHTIEELLRSPSPADSALPPAPRLVHHSIDASGADNTTAVVIEIG
jgi:protein phosphatase